MCLILLSYRTDPLFPLVLAANRDEFYDRPAAPMSFWSEAPQVLAGRDLLAGGTWFGITRAGRWAAITNFRDPERHRADAPSRGLLVSDFLLGDATPVQYLESLQRKAGAYNGFSLLIGDTGGVFYFSNRCDGIQALRPGTYGLSNRFLDTPWPKVVKGKEALAGLLARGALKPAELFSALSDRVTPDDSLLPETGVGREWERVLSPLFISSPVYGTRSSTVLLIDREGTIRLWEKTFNSHPEAEEERSFEFRIGETP